jgi:hypothetical protein
MIYKDLTRAAAHFTMWNVDGCQGRISHLSQFDVVKTYD